MQIVLYGKDRLRREVVEDALVRLGLPFGRAEDLEDIDEDDLVLVSDDVLEGKEVEALRAFVRYG